MSKQGEKNGEREEERKNLLQVQGGGGVPNEELREIWYKGCKNKVSTHERERYTCLLERRREERM
jgi:hypothetical protein